MNKILIFISVVCLISCNNKQPLKDSRSQIQHVDYPDLILKNNLQELYDQGKWNFYKFNYLINGNYFLSKDSTNINLFACNLQPLHANLIQDTLYINYEPIDKNGNKIIPLNCEFISGVIFQVDSQKLLNVVTYCGAVVNLYTYDEVIKNHELLAGELRQEYLDYLKTHNYKDESKFLDALEKNKFFYIDPWLEHELSIRLNNSQE